MSIYHAVRRALKSDEGGSFVARGLALPISAVCTLIITALVIRNLGVNGYAIFAIIISVPHLVPISDFGLSVSLTDSLAKYGPKSEHFQMTWRRVRRLLAFVAVISTMIGLIVAGFGGWATLLRLPAGLASELSGVVVMVYLGIGIYLGAGQRILLGLQKQKIAVYISGLSGPCSLLFVWVSLLITESNLISVVIANCLGPLIANTLIYLKAIRSANNESIDRVHYVRISDRVSTSYRSVIRASVPMAIISISLPLTYQSDRVLLSHLMGPAAVASYSLVSTLYMPLLSLITVSSQSLWPKFIASKAKGKSMSTELLRGSILFCIVGMILSVSLIALGPLIVSYLSDGLAVPSGLYFAFGALLIAFGASAASGMLQMDFKGRVIQAVGAMTMVVFKLPLAIYLIGIFGPTGAVLGTLIPLIVVMILPTTISAIIRIKNGEL